MWENKLTLEDRKKIKEIYATGISQNRLAKMYKVDHSTIRYHLHNADKVSLAPKIDVDKIIQLYREGKNFTEIAEIVKCSIITVAYRVKASKYYDPIRKIIKRYKSKAIKFSDYHKREQKRVVKQIQCAHPSFKCGKCGKWYDNAREQIMARDRTDR